jgi:outer membrane protein
MPLRSGRKMRFGMAALVAALPLACCATDELARAPDTPDRPWVIPPSVPGRPHPDDVARDNAVSIDPLRRYDLAGLIDLAQRNNPNTRAAWEQARQAALAVGLAEANYVPQIAAEALGGFQTTPLPVPKSVIPQGYFVTDSRELLPALTAKWLLFDFGQRAGAVQAARVNSFVANVDFTGAHQKLIYSVSRDYFALGAARGRLGVAQQALKTAKIVQDAAETRQAHGLATVVEVARARRQSAQAQSDLERATGAEHAAYAALIASMGVAPSTLVRTTDSSEQRLPAMPSGDVDRFIRDALINRPDIIAALGKVQAAEAMLGAARATYYPTVAVEAQAYENVGGFSTDGSPYYSVNKPGSNILLKLSLPLFDGGAREARVATARSEVAAAHASLDQARDNAAQQVTNAYDALHTSFAEYAAALTLNDAAQTAYDAALDAYRHGVGTYVDLANDETSLSRAHAEKEDAHANVFTAAAALAFATGAVLSQP